MTVKGMSSLKKAEIPPKDLSDEGKCLLAAEEEANAIQTYLNMADNTSDERLKDNFQEVAEDEMEHLGKDLTTAMHIRPELAEYMSKGVDEAEEEGFDIDRAIRDRVTKAERKKTETTDFDEYMRCAPFTKAKKKGKKEEPRAKEEKHELTAAEKEALFEKIRDELADERVSPDYSFRYLYGPMDETPNETLQSLVSRVSRKLLGGSFDERGEYDFMSPYLDPDMPLDSLLKNPTRQELDNRVMDAILDELGSPETKAQRKHLSKEEDAEFLEAVRNLLGISEEEFSERVKLGALRENNGKRIVDLSSTPTKAPFISPENFANKLEIAKTNSDNYYPEDKGSESFGDVIFNRLGVKKGPLLDRIAKRFKEYEDGYKSQYRKTPVKDGPPTQKHYQMAFDMLLLLGFLYPPEDTTFWVDEEEIGRRDDKFPNYLQEIVDEIGTRSPESLWSESGVNISPALPGEVKAENEFGHSNLPVIGMGWVRNALADIAEGIRLGNIEIPTSSDNGKQAVEALTKYIQEYPKIGMTYDRLSKVMEDDSAAKYISDLINEQNPFGLRYDVTPKTLRKDLSTISRVGTANVLLKAPADYPIRDRLSMLRRRLENVAAKNLGGKYFVEDVMNAIYDLSAHDQDTQKIKSNVSSVERITGLKKKLMDVAKILAAAKMYKERGVSDHLMALEGRSPKTSGSVNKWLGENIEGLQDVKDRLKNPNTSPFDKEEYDPDQVLSEDAGADAQTVRDMLRDAIGKQMNELPQEAEYSRTRLKQLTDQLDSEDKGDFSEPSGVSDSNDHNELKDQIVKELSKLESEDRIPEELIQKIKTLYGPLIKIPGELAEIKTLGDFVEAYDPSETWTPSERSFTRRDRLKIFRGFLKSDAFKVKLREMQDISQRMKHAGTPSEVEVLKRQLTIHSAYKVYLAHWLRLFKWIDLGIMSGWALDETFEQFEKLAEHLGIKEELAKDNLLPSDYQSNPKEFRRNAKIDFVANDHMYRAVRRSITRILPANRMLINEAPVPFNYEKPKQLIRKTHNLRMDLISDYAKELGYPVPVSEEAIPVLVNRINKELHTSPKPSQQKTPAERLIQDIEGAPSLDGPQASFNGTLKQLSDAYEHVSEAYESGSQDAIEDATQRYIESIDRLLSVTGLDTPSIENIKKNMIGRIDDEIRKRKMDYAVDRSGRGVITNGVGKKPFRYGDFPLIQGLVGIADDKELAERVKKYRDKGEISGWSTSPSVNVGDAQIPLYKIIGSDLMKHFDDIYGSLTDGIDLTDDNSIISGVFQKMFNEDILADDLRADGRVAYRPTTYGKQKILERKNEADELKKKKIDVQILDLTEELEGLNSKKTLSDTEVKRKAEIMSSLKALEAKKKRINKQSLNGDINIDDHLISFRTGGDKERYPLAKMYGVDRFHPHVLQRERGGLPMMKNFLSGLIYSTRYTITPIDYIWYRGGDQSYARILETMRKLINGEPLDEVDMSIIKLTKLDKMVDKDYHLSETDNVESKPSNNRADKDYHYARVEGADPRQEDTYDKLYKISTAESPDKKKVIDQTLKTMRKLMAYNEGLSIDDLNIDRLIELNRLVDENYHLRTENIDPKLKSTYDRLYKVLVAGPSAEKDVIGQILKTMRKLIDVKPLDEVDEAVLKWTGLDKMVDKDNFLIRRKGMGLKLKNIYDVLSLMLVRKPSFVRNNPEQVLETMRMMADNKDFDDKDLDEEDMRVIKIADQVYKPVFSSSVYMKPTLMDTPDWPLRTLFETSSEGQHLVEQGLEAVYKLVNNMDFDVYDMGVLELAKSYDRPEDHHYVRKKGVDPKLKEIRDKNKSADEEAELVDGTNESGPIGEEARLKDMYSRLHRVYAMSPVFRIVNDKGETYKGSLIEEFGVENTLDAIENILTGEDAQDEEIGLVMDAIESIDYLKSDRQLRAYYKSLDNAYNELLGLFEMPNSKKRKLKEAGEELENDINQAARGIGLRGKVSLDELLKEDGGMETAMEYVEELYPSLMGDEVYFEMDPEDSYSDYRHKAEKYGAPIGYYDEDNIPVYTGDLQGAFDNMYRDYATSSYNKKKLDEAKRAILGAKSEAWGFTDNSMRNSKKGGVKDISYTSPFMKLIYGDEYEIPEMESIGEWHDDEDTPDTYNTVTNLFDAYSSAFSDHDDPEKTPKVVDAWHELGNVIYPYTQGEEASFGNMVSDAVANDVDIQTNPQSDYDSGLEVWGDSGKVKGRAEDMIGVGWKYAKEIIDSENEGDGSEAEYESNTGASPQELKELGKRLEKKKKALEKEDAQNAKKIEKSIPNSTIGGKPPEIRQADIENTRGREKMLKKSNNEPKHIEGAKTRILDPSLDRDHIHTGRPAPMWQPADYVVSLQDPDREYIKDDEPWDIDKEIEKRQKK